MGVSQQWQLSHVGNKESKINDMNKAPYECNSFKVSYEQLSHRSKVNDMNKAPFGCKSLKVSYEQLSHECNIESRLIMNILSINECCIDSSQR